MEIRKLNILQSWGKNAEYGSEMSILRTNMLKFGQIF